MNGNNQFGAMVPIATYTSTGNTNGTTFNNIPQTFQDLMVVGYGRDLRAVSSENWLFTVNGSSTALYSSTWLFGDGSSASSARESNSGFGYLFYGFTGASAGSGIFGSGAMHILNYANNTTFKTFLGRGASDCNGSGLVGLTATLSRSTAPITTLLVQTFENLVAGSTITLYGIRASNA
jgi:hypothetical protein